MWGAMFVTSADFAKKVVDDFGAFRNRFQKVYPCESGVFVDNKEKALITLCRCNCLSAAAVNEQAF